MAKIDKIACGYTRKFNLGNYQSLELEVTTWADLEPGDDPKQVCTGLQEFCREQVKQEFVHFSRSRAAQETATPPGG